METNTKLFIGIAAGVLVIGALSYFAFFAPSTNNSTNSTNPPTTNTNSGGGGVQVFSPSKLPTGGSVTIPTKKGNVTTENFFLYPEIITLEGEQALYLAKSENFALHYIFSGNYFRIDLKLPKTSYRTEAEKSLRYALNINNQELCKLPVRWIIGGPTGSSYPTDLPLSFCPGALPLE